MNGLSYDGALREIDEMLTRDQERASEQCRSLFFGHGHRTSRATIFYHGLTASPRQFQALAAYAHERGDNVLVPRLPKHGYPDRLGGVLEHFRMADALSCVDRSLRIGHGLADEVRIVGFSLGGLLAAWTAQHRKVGQAICIAPMLGIGGMPLRFLPVATRVLRRLPNRFIWWNPFLRDRLMPAHGYPRFATHAVAEMLTIAGELLDAAKTSGPLSPVVVVTNSGEMGVSNSAVTRLLDTWDARASVPIERRLLRGLGLSHDIVEPLRPGSKTAKSYPALIELLD